MKRLRGEEEEYQGEIEGTHVANWLMLLSRGDHRLQGGHVDHEHEPHVAQGPSRVFECKTCNRRFPSFQALGGHRASHKKPRVVDEEHARVQSLKPRVHECSICGLEFAIGQALGGHMRRHRNVIEEPAVKKLDHGRRTFCLDLNLPPSENDPDFSIGIGFTSTKISLVH